MKLNQKKNRPKKYKNLFVYRWNPGSKAHKGGHDNKTHRKNSNPMQNFNFNASQQQQQQHQSQQQTNNQMNQNKQNYSITPNNYSTSPSSVQACYNKSSSFPNFSSNGNMSGGHHFNHNNTYHRHSVSNLITITPSQTTATIVTPSAPISHKQPKNQPNSIDLLPSSVTKTTCSAMQSMRSIPSNGLNSTTTVITTLPPPSTTTNASKLNQYNARSSSSGGNGSNAKHLSTKNTVGDINSRLEFLCLQMTEQAIN